MSGMCSELMEKIKSPNEHLRGLVAMKVNIESKQTGGIYNGVMNSGRKIQLGKNNSVQR